MGAEHATRCVQGGAEKLTHKIKKMRVEYPGGAAAQVEHGAVAVRDQHVEQRQQLLGVGKPLERGLAANVPLVVSVWWEGWAAERDTQ